MELSSYLRAIRKGWWLVVGLCILGLLGGYFENSRATPIYASHVTFYVSTPTSATTTANSPLSGDQFAQNRVVSYVSLLSSESSAQAVRAAGGVKRSAATIQHEISGSAKLNTVLLSATIMDPSPSQALAIAKNLATTFPDVVYNLDNQGANSVTLHVISGPTVGRFPVSPRKTVNLTIGFLIGLAVGLVAAVTRELLDNSVRTAATLRAVVDAPVLGTVDYDRGARRAPLLIEKQARSVRAEAFRQIRTNLQFSDVDDPLRVIVVTSSVAAEGKSTTATNLSIIVAEAGHSVLLIEGDLRRPRVAEYLGLDRSVGLTNVLVGQADLDDVLQPWGTNGLVVLASGSLPPNPSELLGSEHMRTLIKRLRERFDMIIIDTPPLLPVTDAAVAAVLADGVLIVTRWGKTSRSHLRTAVESLRTVDARVLGCVINMRRARRLGNPGYASYGYHEDSIEQNVGRRRLLGWAGRLLHRSGPPLNGTGLYPLALARMDAEPLGREAAVRADTERPDPPARAR